MPITVRQIRTDEGHLLAELRLAALKDAPSAFSSTYETEVGRGPEEWADRARLGASGAERVTFLAFDDNSPVGLVGGYRPEPEGLLVELVSMWVSPDARRQGAGLALVRGVLRWAETSGARLVGLWVVRGNPPATALYEKAGFNATGECQLLPSDPAREEVRMVRLVGSEEVASQGLRRRPATAADAEFRPARSPRRPA